MLQKSLLLALSLVPWLRSALWAPSIIEKDKKFYLFFSGNHVQKDEIGGIGVAVAETPAGPDYSVAYAIADSPMGPFKRQTKVMQQDPAVGTSAGHHSVIHDPKADLWYAVYHHRPLTETHRDHRVTCIDRMEFDAEGLIKPIKLTTKGVARRTLGNVASEKR